MWHLDTRVINNPIQVFVKGGNASLTMPTGQKKSISVQPPVIFKRWSEAELNAIGIYTLAEIRPTIVDDVNTRWGNPVDDFNAHTRTYPIVNRSVDEKNKEIATARKRAVNTVKGMYLDKVRLLIPGEADANDLIFSLIDILNEKQGARPLPPKKQAINDAMEALQSKRDELIGARDVALDAIALLTTQIELQEFEAVWPAWSIPPDELV